MDLPTDPQKGLTEMQLRTLDFLTGRNLILASMFVGEKPDTDFTP